LLSLAASDTRDISSKLSDANGSFIGCYADFQHCEADIL